MKRLLAVLALTALASHAAFGFQQAAAATQGDAKTTDAYILLALRRAAVAAQQERLAEMYTGSYPSAESTRFELAVLSREMEAMLGLDKSRLPRLSNGYGTMILRKVQLEVGLRDLLLSFTSDHPDVKAQRAELNALEREIENILRR